MMTTIYVTLNDETCRQARFNTLREAQADIAKNGGRGYAVKVKGGEWVSCKPLAR